MSNIFIYNMTQGDNRENIILKSLKSKQEDDDLVIQPGQFISTEEYGIPNRKVEQSFELKEYERNNKIKVSREPLHLNMNENDNKEKISKEDHQRSVDEISATYNMSMLEDIIDQSDDVEKIKAASKRLKDLLEEEGQDIPENEGHHSNPIVGA